MAKYVYKAVDNQGQIAKGTIKSESQLLATDELKRQGYRVLEIKKTSSFSIEKKVGKAELAHFCRQLSYLVSTGIALHRGLELLSNQVKSKEFKETIHKVVIDIKEGMPLSQSIGSYPEVFPESMAFQIKAAEAGGFIEKTLESLANMFEREANFKKSVIGAFMYPVGIFVFAILILVFMILFLVPKMTGMLDSFNTDLPGITQFLLNLSDWAKAYWWIVILVIAVITITYYVLYQDEQKRIKIDYFFLKMPMVGKLVTSINVAKMVRVMGSLMSSGVPIDDTLDNIKNVIENRKFKLEIKNVRDRILQEGISLSKALEDTGLFPETAIQIVIVGEESGRLSEVLLNLADSLETETTELLKTVTGLITPILTLFIGGIVGTVVIALFMPMFSMMDNI